MINQQIKHFLKRSLKYVIHHQGCKLLIKSSFRRYIKHSCSKAKEYVSKLNELQGVLSLDLAFFMESDPAIDQEEEVKLAYPGYLAIACYRIAHLLYEMGFPLEARIISELAHSKTGIDIHPAAKIAAPLFIDHGTGIVIGETTIIGERVKLYQSVTLGALSLAKGSTMKGIKRHPTIGQDVTIYAGASILGDVSIGDHVVIGSNVFLTENIPANYKVKIGKPELTIIKKEMK